MEDEDLEGPIRYYFFEVFSTCKLYSSFQNIMERWSARGRRLREYRLNRITPRYDIDEIIVINYNEMEDVRQLLDGPECLVYLAYLATARSPSSSFCCTGINAVFGSWRVWIEASAPFEKKGIHTMQGQMRFEFESVTTNWNHTVSRYTAVSMDSRGKSCGL